MIIIPILLVLILPLILTLMDTDGTSHSYRRKDFDSSPIIYEPKFKESPKKMKKERSTVTTIFLLVIMAEIVYYLPSFIQLLLIKLN